MTTAAPTLSRDVFAVGAEARLVSRILDVATFLGNQDDGEGGQFALYNLRKPIPGHPAGSTVSRHTLEKALGAA
jgi:hypothetical protein